MYVRAPDVGMVKISAHFARDILYLCEHPISKIMGSPLIALTTDIWSSCATQGYETVTVHLITADWKAFSCVLETSGFPDWHTGANIADKLTEICDNYDVKKMVTHVIHDNAANMITPLNILKEKHGWESLRCFAHTLQLCLIRGLEITSIA